MIRNREQKLTNIVRGIHRQVYRRIDREYRHGPSLHFYGRIISLRREAETLSRFLGRLENIEYLYATLGLWDMNTRGAKMKDFDPFMRILQANESNLLALESLFPTSIGGMDSDHVEKILKPLRAVYLGMKLMQTNRRLVSNSKILHFMFPEFLMPMDNNHTLRYLTNGESEVPRVSWNKYWEITRFGFDTMQRLAGEDVGFDEGFNKTLPKVIDNVIILTVKDGR